MLFRGSKDKFDSYLFEHLVGEKGPTLHIVKSEHNYLFGGCNFTSYPRRYVHKSRTKNIYIEPNEREDPKAFLFQLLPNQIKLKNKQDSFYKNKAVRIEDNFLSLFGTKDMIING